MVEHVKHCEVCCGWFSSVRSIEEHCAVEHSGALEGTRRALGANKGDPPRLGAVGKVQT